MKLRVDHLDVGTDTAVTLLAEHYQHTYQLTYDFWRQRNRIFLLLVGAVVVAALLNLDVPEANSLLADLIARAVGVSDNQDRVVELRQQLPYAVIQGGLLLAIFYLTFSLYHRSNTVHRLYGYLAAIEDDLRGLAQFGATGFTREGKHYGAWQPLPLRAVGYVYTGLLGLLLVGLFTVRLQEDIAAGNGLLVAVDIVVALPTIAFFGAYAWSSLRR